MEGHGAQANDHISQVRDDEDPVMAEAQAVADAHDAKVYENEVGHGVDELSTVRRDVVVL